MDATIIIPSYKSEDTIKECLRALLAQDCKWRYEIIVVDSSPDGTTEKIVGRFTEVKFTKLIDKAYPGIARNAGLLQAQGEIVIFVDSDIMVDGVFIDDAIKYYKAGHDIFSVSLDVWPEKGLNISNRLHCFFEFSEFKPMMKEGQRWCLPSAALVVKRQLIKENKFLNMKTGDDTELTVRLRKNGHLLYFNPGIRVLHKCKISFYKIAKKAFIFGVNNIKVRRIHDVSGSYFIRNFFLCFFTLPAFGLVKLVKISWRNITYNRPSDRILYILTLPLVTFLILVWIAGGYRYLFLPKNVKFTYPT